MRALLLATLILAGCPGKPDNGPDPELTGCATDETWRAFNDVEPTAVVDDTQAPTFTAPMAAVPAATRPVFSWTRTASDPGAPDGTVSHPAGGGFAASPDCSNCCSNFNVGSLTTTHLPPISNDVYDLQITVDGVYTTRVITSLQQWAPSDALWATWKGKSLSIKIFRMTLLKNDPREGPFTRTAPTTFTVGS
jgi:hypothetical protein